MRVSSADRVVGTVAVVGLPAETLEESARPVGTVVALVGTVAVVVWLDLEELAAKCRSQGYAFARTGLGFVSDSC